MTNLMASLLGKYGLAERWQTLENMVKKVLWRNLYSAPEFNFGCGQLAVNVHEV